MTQRGLFGSDELPAHCRPQAPAVQAPPIARRSDPPTSRLAAAEIGPSLAECQAGFIVALKALGQPATASEIAAQASGAHGAKMQESYRKRAGELVSAGRIRVAGKRRCRVTNRYARLYELTGK